MLSAVWLWKESCSNLCWGCCWWRIASSSKRSSLWSAEPSLQCHFAPNVQVSLLQTVLRCWWMASCVYRSKLFRSLRNNSLLVTNGILLQTFKSLFSSLRDPQWCFAANVSISVPVSETVPCCWQITFCSKRLSLYYADLPLLFTNGILRLRI